MSDITDLHKKYTDLCEKFRNTHREVFQYILHEEDRRLIYLSLAATKAQLRENEPHFERILKIKKEIDDERI